MTLCTLAAIQSAQGVERPFAALRQVTVDLKPGCCFVLIGENGNVITAQAVSGHPLLQPSAVAAAKASKFRPAERPVSLRLGRAACAPRPAPSRRWRRCRRSAAASRARVASAADWRPGLADRPAAHGNERQRRNSIRQRLHFFRLSGFKVPAHLCSCLPWSTAAEQNLSGIDQGWSRASSPAFQPR